MQREIGIIIRVKEAAIAKQQIKQIVDKQILDHLKKFNVQLKEAGDSTERLGNKASQAKGGLDSFFKTALKGSGILYTLKRGMGFAMEAFEQGAGLERAAVQFESSIGKINEVLPQLRSATRGTVEDMKLLQTANRAVMEGLKPKELTRMYQMATVASRKLGLETEQSIQTITNAVVRQDESALTTLGTILKMNIGLKVQNALIAKNGGVMSGAMAIAIRQSVIMNELNKRFGGFNNLQEDSVELLQRFNASMSNLRATIGQSLGTALAPLLKVLTGLADAVSQFLMAVKDTAGFKSFIQYATILAGIFTAKGLIGGIMTAAKYLGIFTLSLKSAAILAAGFIGFKTLGGDLKDLSGFMEKTKTAFSVFFQMISNYNSETGMTSVLTKDKEALGGLFTVIFQAVKVFMVLKAAATGVFEGIHNMVKAIAPSLGTFGEALSDIFNSLSNNEPLAKASLQRIQEAFKIVTYAVGTTAAAIAAFVTGAAVIAKVVSIAGAVSTAFMTAKSAVVGFLMLTKGFGVVSAIATAISVVTKAVWAFVAAKTAALALMGPVGWGILAGAAVVGAGVAGYAMSRGSEASPSTTSQSMTSQSPEVRSQNVDYMSQENPDLKAIHKEIKALRESNEQMNQRDEQKTISERVQSFTTPSQLFSR